MIPLQSVKKWYHVSPKRFRVGDILIGSGGPNRPKAKHMDQFSCAGFVYLCPSEIPHYTIFCQAEKMGYFVYEVEPFGKVWVGNWDDALCKKARVVRFVGNARGIINRHRRHYRFAQEWLEAYAHEGMNCGNSGVRRLTAAQEVLNYRRDWERRNSDL